MNEEMHFGSRIPVRSHRNRMSTFTFIADYDGGTYISQSVGESPREALRAWSRSFDFSAIPRLSARDALKLRRDLSADTLTPVDSVRSVWCVSGAPKRKGLFLIHIIKTRMR